jgi:hypothetical protein
VQRLLTTAERPDVEHTNLRSAAYNALSDVVHSTQEVIQICLQLMPAMLAKLSETLQMPMATAEDRQKQADLQALFCGVLQVHAHMLVCLRACVLALRLMDRSATLFQFWKTTKRFRVLAMVVLAYMFTRCMEFLIHMYIIRCIYTGADSEIGDE